MWQINKIPKKKYLNRGSYLQCFSWLKHLTKRFCADFSRSVANRMQVITNKIHQNTLINGMRLFFPWELDRLSFSRASGRDSTQNRIYLQRNKRIFTPQWRSSLHAILTQMIRFWVPPMMLSDRSAHTTWIQQFYCKHYHDTFSNEIREICTVFYIGLHELLFWRNL